MITSSIASGIDRSVEQAASHADTSVVKGSQRIIILVAAVAAISASVVVVAAERSHGCEVLARADLFDQVMDFDASHPHETIGAAARAAMVDAGVWNDPEGGDPDIVVRGDGNLVHVGIDGYWIMLASVPDGFVVETPPRPCSVLES